MVLDGGQRRFGLGSISIGILGLVWEGLGRSNMEMTSAALIPITAS